MLRQINLPDQVVVESNEITTLIKACARPRANYFARCVCACVYVGWGVLVA